MDVERLRSLANRYPAIDVVPRVESTNARLIADAAGLADRTVLIAEEQTAGQGRRSRSWVSPAGIGLYLSVLLRPPLPAGRLSWLTLLAGVALVRTARAAGAQAVLKWPNDLLLGPDQRKAAGILAEATQGAVVLGIGLNLRPLPPDVPLGPGGLAPTSLAEAVGGDVDPTEIAVRLLTELADLDDAWRAAAGDPTADGMHDEYTGYCVTIGQRARVELLRGTVTGTALRVDPSGGLLLRADDGSDQVISAGDVVHLRPAH